jgi:hypothetical protein
VREPPFFKIEQKEILAHEIEEFVAWYVIQTESADILDTQIDNEAAKLLVERASQTPLFKSVLASIPLGTALSCYFWMLWGVFMGKNADIEFDYITFSNFRYETYSSMKKEI